jgi:hypothetical protein
MPSKGLMAPEMVTVDRRNSGEGRIRWTTAYAGSEPIVKYEIWRDGEKAVTLPFEPQTTDAPFEYNDGQAKPFGTPSTYFLRTVDRSGKYVDSKTFELA